MVTDNGWSNGWIQTALALRSGETFLWDVLAREGGAWDAARLKAICREMLLDRADAFCAPAE